MMSNQLKHKAIPILKTNLSEIHTVSEWANYLGYSRAYFTVLIEKEFDETPHELICREKYKKVSQVVHKNPNLKGWVIARQVGFKDVKTLYKFLHRNYHTSITEMRNREKNSS